MTRALALLIALVASGCAEDGILELDLVLPSAADACGATQVGVEARIPPEGSCFFDQEWLDGDHAVLALEPIEVRHRVSVVATAEDVARPLCLRVRACNADACPPPEVTIGVRAEIAIERAFYLGQYTALELGPIDLCADSRTDVGKCEVEGCAAGAPRDTFCTSEGRHLCEP